MAVYFGQEQGLGELLGAGLGQGISQLAQQKMQQMQTRKGLEALGLPREKARGLAKLPGKIGEIAAQQELSGMRQSAQREQGMQTLASMFGITPQQQIQPGADQIQPSQEVNAMQPQPSPVMGALGYQPGQAAIQALSAGVDIGTALKLEAKAKETSEKIAQKEKISEEKKKAESKRIKEGRITSGLTAARGEAKEAQGRVESYRESADNYQNIRRLLKSGKPITGLPMVALKRFGIDKSVSGWETQLMDKAFTAEPIRALRSLPPQAARLTKVFDTLKDMHGSLINTPEGLDAIARTKIVEAKAAKAVDKSYISMLEDYRKKGKDVPFDIRARAAKSVSEKLNRYGSEIQYIISDSIVKGGAKLSEFKFGEKIIADDGSGRVFVKKKVFGRPTWVTFESE